MGVARFVATGPVIVLFVAFVFFVCAALGRPAIFTCVRALLLLGLAGALWLWNSFLRNSFRLCKIIAIPHMHSFVLPLASLPFIMGVARFVATGPVIVLFVAFVFFVCAALGRPAIFTCVRALLLLGLAG